MLVITGTQRAGTSLIATALRESGFDLASTIDDEAGFGENNIIAAFYRRYLGDPDFPFSNWDPGPYDAGVFPNMCYQVVKASYLTMNPAFVMIWHKYRPPEMGDVFLIMHRNPEDVVASKQRLSPIFCHDSDLLKQTARALRENLHMSHRLLFNFGYMIRKLYFPGEMYQLSLINMTLANLDPEVQIKPEVWARVFDPDKIHIRRKE